MRTEYSGSRRNWLLVPATSCLFLMSLVGSAGILAQPAFELEVEPLTRGEKHHFFGYIGQCRTIPWNASGRYVLGLEVDRIDRMPEPDEPATVILVDTSRENEILRVDRTHAWNPQQGTMFFWDPRAAETRFFFNDRDVETGRVFTVLYDVEKRARVREYRFDGIPVGNGGVAANGKAYLALNYGRLARLRPVTGYPGALDVTREEPAPERDGIFVVDTTSGRRRLLVSYGELSRRLTERGETNQADGLFINHTLPSRGSDRVYFYIRAGWRGPREHRIDRPASIRIDGTGLKLHDLHIGGHPEWAGGSVLIGRQDSRQILYDVELEQVVGQLGTPEIFPKPGGDIALSPDGRWFVNGHSRGSRNHYDVFCRITGAHARSKGLARGSYRGDIRIDPAPRWNRDGTALLVPGIAENGTRQMFKMSLRLSGEAEKR